MYFAGAERNDGVEIQLNMWLTFSAVIREFKFDFRYEYRYQQQVMRMSCARKKPEEKCIGSRHYRSQGYFGSGGN